MEIFPEIIKLKKILAHKNIDVISREGQGAQPPPPPSNSNARFPYNMPL